MKKVELNNHNYEIVKIHKLYNDNNKSLLQLIISETNDINSKDIINDFNDKNNILDILSQLSQSIEYNKLYSIEKYENYLLDHKITQMNGGGYHIQEIRKSVYIICLDSALN